MGKKKGSGITFEARIGKGPSKWQVAEEFRTWGRKELAQHAKSVIDAANKRIKRLEQEKILSPALHAVYNSGGKFSRAGNLKQLQHEYVRAVNFMNMQTSSVSTAKRYEKAMEEKIGKKLTREQKTKLFKVFKGIEKITPAGIQAYGSDKLVQYLADEITAEDDAIENDEGQEDWDAMLNRIIDQEIMPEYIRKMDEFNEAFKDTFSM